MGFSYQANRKECPFIQPNYAFHQVSSVWLSPNLNFLPCLRPWANWGFILHPRFCTERSHPFDPSRFWPAMEAAKPLGVRKPSSRILRNKFEHNGVERKFEFAESCLKKRCPRMAIRNFVCCFYVYTWTEMTFFVQYKNERIKDRMRWIIWIKSSDSFYENSQPM